MDFKFDTTECKKLFGIEYGDLLRLQKYNEVMLKDKTIENEVYCKIVTLNSALKNILKLFN